MAGTFVTAVLDAVLNWRFTVRDPTEIEEGSLLIRVPSNGPRIRTVRLFESPASSNLRHLRIARIFESYDQLLRKSHRPCEQLSGAASVLAPPNVPNYTDQSKVVSPLIFSIIFFLLIRERLTQHPVHLVKRKKIVRPAVRTATRFELV